MNAAKHRHGGRGERTGREGTALVAGLVAVLGLMGMSAAILTITLSSKDERLGVIDANRAAMVAGAGVAHALANLTAGNEDAIGSADQAIEFSSGGYFVTIADNGDGTYTVTSTGTVRGQRAGVEAVLRAVDNGIYDNAIYAGNSSGDPSYSLELGGEGDQRDEVQGDIYSGNDIDVEGDAALDGTARAFGTITGISGVEGAGQNVPDLFAMNYETTADVDVLSEFLEDYSYSYDSTGGYAYQAPESSPVHIFRINPSDRKSAYQGTEKLDFFLEDPYENVHSDPQQSGKDATKVSLSGQGGDPGVNGNELVYFIDGNLWLHNLKTYSFKFETASGGLRATFVVKGNIYFSDNLFYSNKNTDAVAFLAMRDPDVEDSGNIYFGDPTFGTLKRMESFMYAENDFYDLNLDASGSSTVEVFGNMTAGNQVVIERDYHTNTGTKHTKLTVDFDERIADGSVELPGLPSGSEGPDRVLFEVVSWRHVGVD